ncbi:MAG: hypothetical protein Q7S10_00155 [bacterium]|nr:hypothetical protein [bacterium]
MTLLLPGIFFVAFFLNLLYEVLHSILYETCLKAPLKKYIYLILKAALFDGMVIVLIYFDTYLIFKNQNPFSDAYQVMIFIVSSLLFAYIWEIYSLKKGKWEYSASMPIVLGVGVTPLVQLSLTGLASIYIVFQFLYN